MELIFFILFASIAVGTALYVVIAKNPINSAISLIVTFLALAGTYVLLSAHFLAVIQVLVYGGAIMVLFLFVIMLLNLRDEDLGPRKVSFLKIVGGVLIAGLVLVFVAGFVAPTGCEDQSGQSQTDCLAELVSGTDLEQMGRASDYLGSANAETWGGIDHVSTSLFSTYLLPFEMVSILLLTAMVGALLIAKRKI